jgi:hypothetical protein
MGNRTLFPRTAPVDHLVQPRCRVESNGIIPLKDFHGFAPM